MNGPNQFPKKTGGMPGTDLYLIWDRIGCRAKRLLCVYQPQFKIHVNCHKGKSTLRPFRSLVSFNEFAPNIT